MKRVALLISCVLLGAACSPATQAMVTTTEDPTANWSPEQREAVARSSCSVDDVITGVRLMDGDGAIVSRCHARAEGWKFEELPR